MSRLFTPDHKRIGLSYAIAASVFMLVGFSLMMLMGTLGRQYSLPEFRAILEGAGFTEVRACRTGGGYYSLVSATKP